MIAFEQRQNLIGDALGTIPYILARAAASQGTAYVGRQFNPAVIPLLDGLHPIAFCSPPGPCPILGLDLSAMWHFCERHNWPWNMAQGYFAFYGLPVPDLPMTYAMNTEFSGLPRGIVISPFSRTNDPLNNNKLWPHERWIATVQRLQARGYDAAVYVIGADDHGDEYRPYDDAGFIRVFNRPLTQILDMLRVSPLVLTVDNGIAHLCHFGGVKRHVMIYAGVLPPKLAESPFAQHARGRVPAEITVDDVFPLCELAMAVE